MKNWRRYHLDKLQDEGRSIIMEGATMEHFVSMSKAKKLPPGSSYFWSIGIVSPPVGYKPPSNFKSGTND